jgi:hypothetical protein
MVTMKSENLKIEKKDEDAVYNATCIHCGDTDGIQLWPHRNGHGNMIGIVFACAACAEVVKGVNMEVRGIRGHADDVCRWSVDDDGTWFSACGEAHVFTSGDPTANHFDFCPYCGRKRANPTP